MRYLFLLVMVLMLSACHEGDGIFHLIVAEPVIAIEPQVLPEEEVGLSEPDPAPVPPCEVVKANITRDGRKLYHLAGMPNFDQVKIDEAAGERFFCNAAEAEAAGWTRANN